MSLNELSFCLYIYIFVVKLFVLWQISVWALLWPPALWVVTLHPAFSVSLKNVVVPLLNAILSSASVDVALCCVLSTAVSSHYVGPCHSDARKFGFKAVQEKNMSLKTRWGRSQNNKLTTEGHSRGKIVPNLLQCFPQCRLIWQVNVLPSINSEGLSSSAASTCIMLALSSSSHRIAITRRSANSSNSHLCLCTGRTLGRQFSNRNTFFLSAALLIFHCCPTGCHSADHGPRYVEGCLWGGGCGNMTACFSLHQMGTDHD